MPHSVAIIMRSKNEMPRIHSALEMLKKQTFTDFELFAVDSGSTDGSLELLKQHCDVNHLTKISPENYAPGKVLNAAIARTNHQIIVLLNADAVPLSENWLAQLVNPILKETADATFSRQVASSDARFIVDYDYQRAFDPNTCSSGFFSAVACAFHRKLWNQHKFHNQGYAEDTLWATSCITFGACIQLVSESIVEHSHNYPLPNLFRKKFRQGNAFAKIQGQSTTLGWRFYLCGREIVRDFIFACRQQQARTIPYNMAYRITIHAGLYRGIKAGGK